MSEEKSKILAICMPLYDGKLCWETMMRLRQDETALVAAGWQIEHIFLPGCSAITVARSELVGLALERGCDVIAFVDGDMDWNVRGLTQLVEHDVDIIGAPVPLKKAVPIVWNVGWLNKDINTAVTNDKGLIEVAHVGTGMMVVKRRVFDILRDHLGRDYRYLDRNHGGERCAFFEAPLAWGEDARFCHLWRQIGGKVYVDPTLTMKHIIAPNWAITAQLSSWLEEERERMKDAA